MVVVPAPIGEIEKPETVATAVLLEERATVRFAVDVGATTKAPEPTNLLGIEAKVMVWLALLMVITALALPKKRLSTTLAVTA
jgi:hypothetical protein